jgi:lipopolysaccharide export system permease protein
MFQRLRHFPWLTAIVFGCGLAVAGWHIATQWQALSAAEQTGISFTEGVKSPSTREASLRFLQQSWSWSSLCLAPAAVLAMLRLRGRQLIFPLFVVCLWLLLYWLGTDLLSNLHRIRNDPLGMEPSPAAYYWKLILMGAFVLSPPGLLWLYYRSTLLDRYVVRSFASPFLLCLCGICGILISMDLLNNANDYVAAGYGVGKVFIFYLGQMPRILVSTTEAALLLATLFSLGKMSRHNELAAMNSAGRSVFRVLLPLLVWGLWCSLAMLAMNYQFAPEAQRLKEEIKVASNKAADDDPVVLNVLYRNREAHRTWYLHSVPYDLREDNPMSDVYVWQQNAAGDLLECDFARTALWVPETGMWKFYNVVHYAFTGPEGRLPSPLRSESPAVEKTDWRETPGGMLNDKLNADFLGVPTLLSCLKGRASLPEKAIARYETDLQWRFALPFRCFLIVLLAAPLGIVASRRNVLGGVAAALGIFVAVFFLSTMLLKSGEGNYLPPWVAAWGVNFLFAAIGIALFWFRSKNRLAPSLNPLGWFRKTA